MDLIIRYICLVCAVLSVSHVGHSARFLMTPFLFGSHVSQHVNIGEKLMEKGHEVYVLTSPTFPGLPNFKKSNVSFIEYKMFEPDFYSFDQENQDNFFEEVAKITLIQDFRTSIKGFKEMCTNPLQDQELFLKLKDMKFDMAVIDIFPFGRCMLVLMHRLGIPYINLKTQIEPWIMRSPSLPSFVPFIMGNHPYSEQMNFWERLDNAWTIFEWSAFTGVLFIEDDFLKEYFYETTPVPLNYLAGQGLLWLNDVDVAIDYPRPMMANEVHIGGLTTKPAKPLPADLENFMKSATEGVVVVSFGSMSANLPPTILDKFLEAFKRVNYNIIMRHPHSPPKNLPKRIQLLSWLPQNDLLGHPNTKLFITHGGANGGNEALYHGVPMIVLPVFAEQPYNAKRVVYHGFGLHLNLFTFQVDDLVGAINEIITNKTYSENIKLGSQIFRDRPMHPSERAVYWIEHVLHYGGKHLHSHALEMPWYQYMMLDLLAFVVGLFLAGILAVSCLIYILWARFCSGQQTRKMKTQ